MTSFDKIADLSLGQAPSCTTIRYFEKRFQGFLCGMILGFVRSKGVSTKPYPTSIGLTVVKKTACLPVLSLIPPGINPFLVIELTSFAFPT